MPKAISHGTVHKLPADLRKILAADAVALDAWENLSPLARNEWLCWIESAKKAETRQAHIDRACNDLKQGKRRPCCWMGCTHRTDKPLSPSQKFLLEKRTPKKKPAPTGHGPKK